MLQKVLSFLFKYQFEANYALKSVIKIRELSHEGGGQKRAEKVLNGPLNQISTTQKFTFFPKLGCGRFHRMVGSLSSSRVPFTEAPAFLCRSSRHSGTCPGLLRSHRRPATFQTVSFGLSNIFDVVIKIYRNIF
jgi:hypothetical protein